MPYPIRGTGFRHTLPAVFRSSAVWFIMFVMTTPTLTVSMMMAELVPPELHEDVWFFLLTRMPFILLAGVVMSIVTTARVAGPSVVLRRAFEDVRDGDMDRRLSFRKSDGELLGLATAFEEMMVALNERADSRVAQGDGEGGAGQVEP
jgi:hypothetical protein